MLPVAERGSKPRNNALCTVCCMETLYVSLRDSTNRAFLNPIQLPRAFVHTPQKVRPCTSLSSLRESGNLRRAPDLAQFHRISFCAPEPRDNALCTVCCMETLYVSLRDATNKMFLNPSLRPTLLYTHPKQAAFVHQLQDLP